MHLNETSKNAQHVFPMDIEPDCEKLSTQIMSVHLALKFAGEGLSDTHWYIRLQEILQRFFRLHPLRKRGGNRVCPLDVSLGFLRQAEQIFWGDDRLWFEGSHVRCSALGLRYGIFDFIRSVIECSGHSPETRLNCG